MLLVVDIGNTNIKFGVYKKDRLIESFTLYSSSIKTKDEYAVDLSIVLNMKGIKKEEINNAILGSVVPATTNCIKNAIMMAIGVQAREVKSDLDLGLKANKSKPLPEELGADILEFAVAVKEIYKKPAIMIDMGTATTIFALNTQLELEGGLIMAGPATAINHLVKQTALLTSTDIKEPDSVLGINTSDCISSGYIYGGACMIDGICKKVENHVGEKCIKIATGGLSKRIIKYCKEDIIYDGEILLKGLKIINNKIMQNGG